MPTSRLLGTMLFGVSPRDPVVFGVSAMGLLAVALGAAVVPARRAARVHPAETLHAE
jgi:ABC-type lipoprotein release transport system permease subunit